LISSHNILNRMNSSTIIIVVVVVVVHFYLLNCYTIYLYKIVTQKNEKKTENLFFIDF
jgi:cytochrome bd-type quinol oxidase subunit 2